MPTLLTALMLTGCIQDRPALPDEAEIPPGIALASNGDIRDISLADASSATVRRLEQTAKNHDAITVRGEAIVALAQSTSPDADDALARLVEQSDSPLVQTWAAAAQVQRADSMDALVSLAPLLPQFPALSRPIMLQLERLPAGDVSVIDGLTMAMANTELQAMVLPILQQQGGAEVMSAMLRHPSPEGRRLAAGMLAGMAQEDGRVRQDILAAMAYLPGATSVPWQGGALYIPSASWSHREARSLVTSLVSWHLHCEQTQALTEQQQINNNLRSVGLLQTAGFPRSLPADTDSLLRVYGQTAGADALHTMLREHGLAHSTRFQPILTTLGG